jgi:hypothetical protein
LTKQHLLQRARRVVSIVFLLSLAGCSSSTLLVLNTLVRFDDYSIIEDVAYGEQALNRLNIYLPARKQASRATVVFFYGGC